MKKIILVFILAIIGIRLDANPIPVPTLAISELYFENSNDWKLEIKYDYIYTGFSFDSIFLCSGQDSVKLPDYPLTGYSGHIVLTNDSLSSAFHINRFGDILRLTTYSSIFFQFTDELLFGNVNGSVIDYPLNNQSISKYSEYFVKDDSPTLGFPNDTVGMCGTITGTVYDSLNIPVPNRKFYLDYQFLTSADGKFSTRVLSKPTVKDYLFYTGTYIGIYTISIDSISYVMEPDSLITLDIRLRDSLLPAGIDAIDATSPVKFFPNPVSRSGILQYEIDLPVKTSVIRVEIMSIDGKLLDEINITEKSGVIKMPENSGNYLLNVRIDNKLIKSIRVICK